MVSLATYTRYRCSDGRDSDTGAFFLLFFYTSTESLKTYFSRFGELTDCMVMKDPVTNKSRGFGFLTFVDPKNVDAVLKEDHYLDGKMASWNVQIAKNWENVALCKKKKDATLSN